MLACVPSWWNVECGLSVSLSTEYTWDLALPHVKHSLLGKLKTHLGPNQAIYFLCCPQATEASELELLQGEVGPRDLGLQA